MTYVQKMNHAKDETTGGAVSESAKDVRRTGVHPSNLLSYSSSQLIIASCHPSSILSYNNAVELQAVIIIL